MTMKIGEFLRADYPTISLKGSLQEAMDRLLDSSASRADCLVVVDADGRPVGLVNDWLVVRALAIGAERASEPAVDVLMKDRLRLPVSAAMAATFPVADPESDLFAVLAMLGSDLFECLPVMKDGKYLGAVRTIDVFQAVAEEVLGGASGGVFTEGQ
jgi:CBS domain-containing protein